MSVSTKRYTVGVLVFNGADILDFAGPIEIFSHVSTNKNPDNPDRMYKCLTIGRTPTIRAADSLTVSTDLLIEDALRDLDQFDMLVVPGGPPAVLAPLLGPDSPEMKLVTAFAKLQPKSAESEPRTLFSVCVGAFFLGAAGILGGLNVTTHHRALERLGQICQSAGSQPASIVETRYVDGGLSKVGPVSVVTAGGISSGLDASLYIVSKQISKDMADFIGRVMEYESRVAV
ncbi:ThiJ/PfpI family protein [Xylogone sp. PMI_703]|nr:ThiJ/PfpI family protein [Xylogone sp. PMI_703]